jgi:hypothetical protein
MDVGQEDLRSRARTAVYLLAKHLILGQEFPNLLSGRRITRPTSDDRVSVLAIGSSHGAI